MIRKSMGNIFTNTVCIALAMSMLTGCGVAKAEVAPAAEQEAEAAEETASDALADAPKKRIVAEYTNPYDLKGESDAEEEVATTSTEDTIDVDATVDSVPVEKTQTEYATIELSSIKKEANVHFFAGTVDYNGEIYSTDEFGYHAFFPVFPIDREFHGQFLELKGAEYVVLYSMLINDGYIYYTIDDRSEGQGMVPRLQLWKTPLTGGEPKLLYNTCYGDCNLAMVNDQIVLTDFETMKTMVIDLDGNVKVQIAEHSNVISATNEKIFVIDWDNNDIVTLDYSGNELQRFDDPHLGYTGSELHRLAGIFMDYPGTVQTYNGAVVYLANRDSYGAYLFPDEGTDLIEILDVQGKGFVYDLTDEGFYYLDGNNLCFYNSMDKQTTQLVSIDEKLDCAFQVGDKLIYETGRSYEHDNACDYMRTLCVYDLTTKENKVCGEYILLP